MNVKSELLKKIVKVFGVLLIINTFISLTDVFAVICDPEEYKVLREKADAVEFHVERKLVEIDDYLINDLTIAQYDITAYNASSDLDIYAQYGNESDNRWQFKYNNDRAVLNDFGSGKVTIKFIGNSGTCLGSTIKNETLMLQFYNVFYESDECKQYPDFKYCQGQYVDNYVDNVVFYHELEDYLESKEQIKEDDEKEEIPLEDNNYLKYVPIIFLGIIILFGIVYVFYKLITKTKQRRNL